jgi:hypothetical protein
MKYIQSIATALTILALFTSCEKEIEFDEKLISPRLTINSFLEQDSLVTVNIASSKPIPGIATEFKWIDNATVKLFVDGEEKETLTVIDVKRTPYGYSSVNGDTTFFYNESEPTKKYKTAQTKAEVGKTYKLEVTHPDFETVYGETTIPTPIPILSFDTATVITNQEWGGYENFQAKIKFKDPLGEKNYYRLVYSKFAGVSQSYGSSPNDGDSMIYLTNELRGTYINSSDKLLNPSEEDANDFLFGSAGNYYNLFTDELIDGKEYELSFTVDLMNNYYGGSFKQTKKKGEFMRLTITLQSITREAYLYMKSVHANKYYESDFFSEPVQVFTNIENGIGIFAGSSSSSVFISSGEYPVEGVKYEVIDLHYGW